MPTHKQAVSFQYLTRYQEIRNVNLSVREEHTHWIETICIIKEETFYLVHVYGTKQEEVFGRSKDRWGENGNRNVDIF